MFSVFKCFDFIRVRFRYPPLSIIRLRCDSKWKQSWVAHSVCGMRINRFYCSVSCFTLFLTPWKMCVCVSWMPISSNDKKKTRCINVRSKHNRNVVSKNEYSIGRNTKRNAINKMIEVCKRDNWRTLKQWNELNRKKNAQLHYTHSKHMNAQCARINWGGKRVVFVSAGCQKSYTWKKEPKRDG